MQPPTSSTMSPPPSSPLPKGHRFKWWVAVLALSAALVFWFVLHSRAPEKPVTSGVSVEGKSIVMGDKAPQWEYVKIATAEEGPPFPSLPAPGRVGYDVQKTASLGAPMVGRVEQVKVRLGDQVKTGDKLFSVRSRDYAELDREYASAQEAVAVKRRLRDRAQELLTLNAIPEKDFLAAEAELKEAELTLRAAEAKRRSLSVIEEAENLFWVRAPRDGIVVSLDVVESQEVSPERAEPLLRISELANVLIEADVLEVDARELKEGSMANIQTREGLIRQGTIQYVSRIIDPQRQTVTIRINAANSDLALKPNAFVDVTFNPRQELRVVRVDEDAVVSDGATTVVFVLKDSNRLVKQPVQPGRRAQGQVEILTGLSPGTQYAAKGALLLLNQLELAE